MFICDYVLSFKKVKNDPEKGGHSSLVPKARLHHWIQRAGPLLRLDRKGINGCIVAISEISVSSDTTF